MRICLVYDCLFPWTVGGAERWLRNLGEALAAAGHDVTYLTRQQWPEGETPHIPGVRVIAVSPFEPLYGPDGNRTIGEALRFGWGVLRHLAIRGHQYDVVHTASFPYFSLLAAAVMRRRGRYVIAVDWHEVWSGEYWVRYLGPVRGRVAIRIQRACARVQQHAFCFSQLHAARLVREGLSSRPTVLRGEYSGPPPRSSPSAAQPIVFFAGRLIPEKRVRSIVPAVVRASPRIPGLRAVIFGDGPEKEALEADIGRLGAADLVRAPGFVSSAEVEDALRPSLCLLLPSSREGYGLIVVEAAAAGVPSIVVAGPDNAAVELIESGINGFIAPSTDAADLADVIVRVHEAGYALRQSTAEWFVRNAHTLSLGGSLERVVATYSSGAATL